ncbi:SET domain-containing protein 4, partial [Tetrabaena socialis]
HLREAFESSSPAFACLLAAYPTYFQPHWFSWEAYLWAAELWYSYGIQVQFPDGVIRTCLAPYVGLMNHHPLPHVVHFSKVDAATGCLGIRAFRPCAPGRQLFLSYGPYGNGKLLLFYGFALRHNPFDEVELELK